jgi:acetylcholinesterase
VCLGISVQLPSSSQAEDCLFIDVWAPASATTESNLPVWVFIQGGGYTQNANANYNGSTVVANSNQNIVFVEFNYRVGPWGFLASNKVSTNGDLNAGLLDQRKALQWVQQHIGQFGGNPNQVVIHGESAGAGSIAIHLIAL